MINALFGDDVDRRRLKTSYLGLRYRTDMTMSDPMSKKVNAERFQFV